MFTRILLTILTALCLAAFVGCEGDQGPAGPQGPPGPNMLLAYADIDIVSVGVYDVFSVGPPGVTIDDVTFGPTLGDYTVTIGGSFPSTTGTLLVSSSSDDTIDDAFSVGTIDSWSTTQIVITVNTYDVSTAAPTNDDFSFAIIGQ